MGSEALGNFFSLWLSPKEHTIFPLARPVGDRHFPGTQPLLGSHGCLFNRLLMIVSRGWQVPVLPAGSRLPGGPGRLRGGSECYSRGLRDPSHCHLPPITDLPPAKRDRGSSAQRGPRPSRARRPASWLTRVSAKSRCGGCLVPAGAGSQAGRWPGPASRGAGGPPRLPQPLTRPHSACEGTHTSRESGPTSPRELQPLTRPGQS